MSIRRSGWTILANYSNHPDWFIWDGKLHVTRSVAIAYWNREWQDMNRPEMEWSRMRRKGRVKAAHAEIRVVDASIR